MSDSICIHLDLSSMDDYRKFLAIKRLPTYSFRGRMAEFPAEYASRIGGEATQSEDLEYIPLEGLFDYQQDIARLAIQINQSN